MVLLSYVGRGSSGQIHDVTHAVGTDHSGRTVRVRVEMESWLGSRCSHQADSGPDGMMKLVGKWSYCEFILG